MPHRLDRARGHWSWRGQTQPAFVVPPGPGQAWVWDCPWVPHLAPESREVVIAWRGIEVARTCKLTPDLVGLFKGGPGSAGR